MWLIAGRRVPVVRRPMEPLPVDERIQNQIKVSISINRYIDSWTLVEYDYVLLISQRDTESDHYYICSSNLVTPRKHFTYFC